jgi:hypothetical protein
MAATMAASMMFPVFALPLEFIFHQIPHDRATHRTKEAMSLLFAKIVSGNTAADRTEETAFTLGHGWGIGVIVRGVLIAGLRGKLMGLAVWIIDLLRRTLAVLRLLRI